MKKTLILSLLLCSCAVPQEPNVIPYPSGIVMDKGCFSLKSSASLILTPGVQDLDGTIVPEEWLSLPVVRAETPEQGSVSLVVNPTLPEEGCQIKVDKSGILVSASSSAGFYYALETLAQLRKGDRIPCLSIEDSPKYAHRGVMIDVSRHFYTMDFLKKQVDLLSRYKINRLQLHLTDAAGWRMEIKRYPRLIGYVAFRSKALWKEWWEGDRAYGGGYGGFYTQDELRSLVEYAMDKHITVIPEVEMPGHSDEVLAAYPELSCAHDGKGDMCAGAEETFGFLENVLDEVMEVFPSEYIHIGGDEAGKASWRNCPKCQKRMRDEKLSDVDDLQGYLIRRIGAYLESKGRKLIGWDEIAQSEMPDNADVMVWRGPEQSMKAIRSGHQVILSPGEYYIDKYQDAPSSQPEAIGGYLPLRKIYEFDPLSGIPAEFQDNVKGLQANLWTEYVPTEADAERMLYPRVFALAQTAWGGEKGRDYERFRAKVLERLPALLSEGYKPFDLASEVGNRPEYGLKAEHLGLGCPVSYEGSYSPKYPASGDTALTDGLQGSWDYGDGRWQGFIGEKGMDVTVDLGKSREIGEVKATFFQSIGAWVYIPAHISISVSEDGDEFTTLLDQNHPADSEHSVKWETLGWSGSGQARFVRFQATCDIVGGWVFTDEIVIK